MIDEITRYKIPIVAIQEVRWLNSGSIQCGNSIILYSDLQTGRHEKGVGFVMDKAMMTIVKKFVPVNERICYIRIAQKKLDLIIFTHLQKIILRRQSGAGSCNILLGIKTPSLKIQPQSVGFKSLPNHF